MWTVLEAGILSLAIVGVRPGARNWLAKAFSVVEDCEREQKTHEIRDHLLRKLKRPIKESLKKNWLFHVFRYLRCTVQITSTKYREWTTVVNTAINIKVPVTHPVQNMENGHNLESNEYCHWPVSLPLEVLSENLPFLYIQSVILVWVCWKRHTLLLNDSIIKNIYKLIPRPSTMPSTKL